jgi:hypothetical protein
MSNPSKAKGTRAETTAKRYLLANGFPECDRQPLHGNRDQGDLIVCRSPKIVAEVKARKGTISEAQIASWWAQTETEPVHANADLAVLIVARHGVSVAAWDAYMPAYDWLHVFGGTYVMAAAAPWLMRASLADWAAMLTDWADVT